MVSVPDKILVLVLKNLTPEWSPILGMMFKYCLKENWFTSLWKVSAEWPVLLSAHLHSNIDPPTYLVSSANSLKSFLGGRSRNIVVNDESSEIHILHEHILHSSLFGTSLVHSQINIKYISSWYHSFWCISTKLHDQPGSWSFLWSSSWGKTGLYH